jgi:hypothetical protein
MDQEKLKKLIGLCEQYSFMSTLTRSDLYLLVTGQISRVWATGPASEIGAFLSEAKKWERSE